MHRKKLSNDYEIREIDTESFDKLWNEHRNRFFDDVQPMFRPKEILSAKEQDQANALREKMGNPFRLNLGLYCGEEFVGWSFGFQESSEACYMCNSVVFPEHRRKGLYTALMHTTLEIVTQMGFQRIYSRHAATNNAVIIPKLKVGFHLTSFELTDLMGVLVHLTYFPKNIRTKMLDYRAGMIKPDEEIRKLLGIWPQAES